MSKTKGINRRSFIKQSTLGLIGGGYLSRSVDSPQKVAVDSETPRIKEYRTLGRTGFKVSDLGMGHVGDEGLLRTFLDAGVNFIDTSEGYRYNERVLGKVMENLDRKSLFITSKVIADTSYKHISQSNITKEGFLKRAYRIMKEIHITYDNFYLIGGHECPNALGKKTAEETGLKYLGKVAYDETLRDFVMRGKSLLNLPSISPAYTSVKRIIERAGYLTLKQLLFHE